MVLKATIQAITSWSWFRSSRMQMFFIIGISQKFRSGKTPVLESLFLIKLHDWRSASLWKRDSNTGIFLWILQKFLTTAFFIDHFQYLLLQFDKVNCCWSSADLLFLIKNTMWDSFYQKGLQILSLHVVTRNHSNMFLLNKNLSKIKHCSKG